MFNFDWIRRLFKESDTGAGRESAGGFSLPPRLASAGPGIISIGGGKGGVGKSLLSSSLGISLSRQDRKVLLIDADLGAANLHTFFGMDGGKAAFSSFLKDEISELKSLIVKTPVPNLDLISGAKDSLDAADITKARIDRLRDAIREADYDTVILDIGPGTAANNLDIFLLAKEGVILATPEPTAIENNYRFLKCLFLRKIKSLAESQEDGRLKQLLHRIFSDRWTQRVKTVSDIIEQVSALDVDQGRFLKEHVSSMSISMILNQSKKGADADIGYAIRKACSDYFGIDVSYLGAVCHDDCVVESIRLRKPLLIHYGSSEAARSIEDCARALLDKKTTLSTTI